MRGMFSTLPLVDCLGSDVVEVESQFSSKAGTPPGPLFFALPHCCHRPTVAWTYADLARVRPRGAQGGAATW